MVVFGLQWENAQLVDHLDDPQEERFVWAATLIKVQVHGGLHEVYNKGVSNLKHSRGMDALECDVAGKLCLDDGTDVCEMGFEVVHVADCSAGGDGGLDLGEVFF